MNWAEKGPPTRIATPERLQCERCACVRYCSAWCAHIHYWACHRYVCPIPPFSSLFNAEYVLRRGHNTYSFPIRCIDAQLLDNGTLNTRPSLQARAHIWATVPHKGSRLRPLACKWCTAPIDIHEPARRHDLWFIGLITRIRAACSPPSCDAQQWAPHLTIYAFCPLRPGAPHRNWPPIHPHARIKHRGEVHPGTPNGNMQIAEAAPAGAEEHDGDAALNTLAHLATQNAHAP